MEFQQELAVEFGESEDQVEEFEQSSYSAGLLENPLSRLGDHVVGVQHHWSFSLADEERRLTPFHLDQIIIPGLDQPICILAEAEVVGDEAQGADQITLGDRRVPVRMDLGAVGGKGADGAKEGCLG